MFFGCCNIVYGGDPKLPELRIAQIENHPNLEKQRLRNAWIEKRMYRLKYIDDSLVGQLTIKRVKKLKF